MPKPSEDVFSEHIRRTLVQGYASDAVAPPPVNVLCSRIEDSAGYLIAVEENEKLRAIGRIFFGEDEGDGFYYATQWSGAPIGMFDTLNECIQAVAEADAG